LTRKRAVRADRGERLQFFFAAPPAHAADASYDIQALDPSMADPPMSAVISGSLDAKFGALASLKLRPCGGAFWLRLRSTALGIPVVVMHAGPQTHADLFAVRGGAAVLLPPATQLRGLRGSQDSVFGHGEGLSTDQT
jgi:hypothetical protein